MLMIVDPSYESLQLSGKVGELAESIGKPYYYILNKVTGENRAMMYENVWKPERIAACLEADTEIMKKGLTGKELTERPLPVEKTGGASDRAVTESGGGTCYRNNMRSIIWKCSPISTILRNIRR